LIDGQMLVDIEIEISQDIVEDNDGDIEVVIVVDIDEDMCGY